MDRGDFIDDPIQNDSTGFLSSLNTISKSLEGSFPGQKEPAYIDSRFRPEIRLEVIEFDGANDLNRCFVTHRDDLIVARQQEITDLTDEIGVTADIVYAVSGSYLTNRASAWFTYDDDSKSGAKYTYDGTTMYHRAWPLAPGSIGIHSSCRPMTVVHEFGHAISSFQNGMIVDLYEDNPLGINKKKPRPGSPAATFNFANYNLANYNWDPGRGGIGYPAQWSSYHCELTAPLLPAMMDNYWRAPSGQQISCRHDQITSAFIRDRMKAKLVR